ncbi:DUF2865 domain-containing protein [soil metagenome]
MRQLSLIRRTGAVALVVVAGMAFSPKADARDFFSSFIGGLFGGRAPAPSAPSMPLPFASEFGDGSQQAQPRVARGGGVAYCVRTCDGRYFPLTATGDQSRAEACKSFCPASETKVVYGGNIDSATTDTGKPYSDLPNAFRYRTELVSGCTCNGKDAGGLARINVENDPTLRKGDLVAGVNGLVVANKSSYRRGASVNFSPATRSARAQFDRVPVVAAE